MEKYSYHGFTMNYTGNPKYQEVKHIIDNTCRNIQQHYYNRDLIEYVTLQQQRVASIVTFNNIVYFGIFLKAGLITTIDDSIICTNTGFRNLARLEDRFINRYSCYSILQQNELFQTEWVKYLKDARNPDLYYNAGITKDTRYIETNISTDSISKSFEREITVNYVFNKYCESIHTNTEKVFESFKKRGFNSHYEIVNYLFSQHIIDESFLPDGTNLSDL